METIFYPIRFVLGVPFIGKGDPVRLGWSLGVQKVHYSVESGPSVLVLVSLEG